MTDITKIAVEDLLEQPLKDLMILQDNVTNAIARKKSTAKTDLAKHIHALAAESGFTLEELITIKVKRERKQKVDKDKMAPMFQSPDGQKTWSGKGPTPKWLKELEEAGRLREEFRIKTS